MPRSCLAASHLARTRWPSVQKKQKTAVDPLERELIDGGLSSEMAATADLLRALGLDAAVATRETLYYPDDILTSEGPYGFTTKGSSNTNEGEVFGFPE